MGFLKGSKFYSMITGKCPVCQTGKMYLNGNAYKISETLKMHDRCPHCNTKFKIEPSFFYGAMYVSYAVGIAFATAAFVIAHFALGWTRFNVFMAIIATLVIFLPVIVRFSRNIWINMFFKFDKKKV